MPLSANKAVIQCEADLLCKIERLSSHKTRVYVMDADLKELKKVDTCCAGDNEL